MTETGPPHHPIPDAPAGAVLRDPLAPAGPIPLNGWAERERFHPLLLAGLGGVFAIVIFQVVASVATGVFLFAELQAQGVEALPVVMANHPNEVFGANAVGQFIGLLMFTILLARLHTVDVFGYMRIRAIDPLFLVFSGLALYALLPFVSFVGELARQLPYPEWMQSWDGRQRELLEMVLGGDVVLPLALLFVALTPAICEEVLFRGYLQRNVERRMGIFWSIVLVGLAFGLFHLRFDEFIPLALLGVFLGYVVWVSGSLWAGVLVHLLNNGTALIVSNYTRTRPEPVALDELSMPWYLAAAGFALAMALCLAMWRRRESLLGRAPS